MPYLQEMCPAQLRQAQEEGWPLLIGAGTIEYHGSQLPLGTDLLLVEGLVREIEKRTPAVIAPPFAYSPTGCAVSGPEQGTVDVSTAAFMRYCGEVLQSYEKMGFGRILVFVHHQGGNIGPMLQTAVADFQMYGAVRELGPGWWTNRLQRRAQTEIRIVEAFRGHGAFGGHGGQGETQGILALYPDLVHMEELQEEEAWWNRTAPQADADTACREMEAVVEEWVEVLRRLTSSGNA